MTHQILTKAKGGEFMQRLIALIGLSIFITACSNDNFADTYQDFIDNYTEARKSIKTKYQSDSLANWSQQEAEKILRAYTDHGGLADSSKLDYADLLRRSGQDQAAIALHDEIIARVGFLNAEAAEAYLGLLMAADISAKTTREKIEKALAGSREVLGSARYRQYLNYAYNLRAQEIVESTEAMLDSVIEAGIDASLSGQAVLEKAAFLFEQKDIDAARSFLKAMAVKFPNNKMVAEKARQFDLIGKPAPDLQSAYTIGAQAALKENRGKVILLDFWAPWCGPCRRSFPELKSLYSEFSQAGLVVIGATNYYNYYRDDSTYVKDISKADYNKKLAYFKRRFALPWPLAVEDGRNNRNTYGVSFIPTFFLIDRQGIVRYAQVGSKTNPAFLRDKVVELL
jgi:thiol-disulfide isomerase/thioredoxin